MKFIQINLHYSKAATEVSCRQKLALEKADIAFISLQDKDTQRTFSLSPLPKGLLSS
jgi:hypothetical protein